jgi:hypothetical protein
VGGALATGIPGVAARSDQTAAPPPVEDRVVDSGDSWASLPADAQVAIAAALADDGVELEEQAKLAASDGASSDQFGTSVAIDDVTIVVGVPNAAAPNWAQGAAYVFTRPPGGWSSVVETAKLTASDGLANDNFGSSVDIRGDTIVVGAPSDQIGQNPRQGSAYVFTMPGGGWTSGTETLKLTAPDGGPYEDFARSVAVGDTTIVIGVPGGRVGDWNSGSAYVFTRPAVGWSHWTEAATLSASDGFGYDTFGMAVDVHDDTIVVGAPSHAVGTHSGQGAAYVFTRPAGGWSSNDETAILTASDGTYGDGFGRAVALSGDTIVVGVPYDTVGSNWGQGSAYAFAKPAEGWANATETARWTASDGGPYEHFGQSVGIAGETIAVGVPHDNVTGWWQGSAYVFSKPAAGWVSDVEPLKLTAADGTSSDEFGFAVAVGDGTVVVGGPFADAGHGWAQGSAYVFAEPNLLPDGTHDAVNGLAPRDLCWAAGWSVDPDDRVADLAVRILADDHVVAEVTAGLFRQDLLDAGVSPDGYSAFEVDLWDLITHDEGHQIRAQAQDAQTLEWVDLSGTPKSLGCSLGAREEIVSLRDSVTKASLRHKLTTVLRHFEAGRYAQAIDNLDAFVNEVEAQSKKASLQDPGRQYLAAAERIATWIKVEAGMVADGVTAWWPANSTPAEMVGGRTAILHGDTGYVPGIDRQAFYLDGDGDFVAMPDDPAVDPGTGDFTVSLWAKFDTIAGEQVLAEKYIERFDSLASTGWTLTKVAGNEVVLALGAGGGGFASVPQTLRSGTWYHFVARRSGNEFAVFRDGTMIASGEASETFSGDLGTSASLKLGHRGNPDDTPGSLDDSNYWLHGAIDEAQLFVGRALSNEEIRAIYRASSLGEPITDRGRVVVTTETDPDGDVQVFSFDGSWSTDSFALADGQYQDSGPLLPGTYSVAGAVPDGWDLMSATCSGDNTTGAITLAPGVVVTCAFEYRADGRLVVVKETAPDGSTDEFGFEPSWGPTFELVDGAEHESGFLDPGTHSVAETTTPGWALSSVSCSDGSTPEAIRLDPGELVRCTFRNMADGRIIVEKQTTPTRSTQQFGFSPSWGPAFLLADGEQESSGFLAPGRYSVAESTPPDWESTSAACSDGSDASAITLDPGEVVTCTFGNRAKGRIVVEKQTDPDGSGQGFWFYGNWDPSYFMLRDGQRHDSGPLSPGAYSVNEISWYTADWDLMSATCSDGSAVAAIQLDPGEVVTCTFSNRAHGRLVVEKQTDPDGSFDTFWFQLGASPPRSFSLRDGWQFATSLGPGTYAVSELVPAGWALQHAVCSDGSPASAVALSPGKTVTCTFVNVRAGPITPPITPPVSPPVTPPVCPPISPPISGPISPPISGPISPPISPPISGPISPPISPPLSPPISGPVSPPITGAITAHFAVQHSTTECLPQAVGLAAFLSSGQAGLVAAVAFGIVALSFGAGLSSPLEALVRRRIRGL